MSLDALLAYFENWTGRPSIAKHCLQFADHGAQGLFDRLRLHSVFQPLFSTAGGAPCAFEALLRVQDEDGRAISPVDAFRIPDSAEEIVYFDRLCRMVHVVNFMTHAGHSQGKLYLNIDARHLTSVRSGVHGAAFEALLRHAGLAPQRVVLEILESGVEDFDLLRDAVRAYQQRGFEVALDDFGSQASNFDRLWRLSPNIVKLDRSLLLQAQSNPRAKFVLPKLVEILHDLDAKVVCEGIETPAQWRIARQAGVDLVQGFLFARPESRLQEKWVLPPEDATPHYAELGLLRKTA